MKAGGIWRNPEDGKRYKLKGGTRGVTCPNCSMVPDSIGCLKAPCLDVAQGYMVPVAPKPKRKAPLVQETSREALRSQETKAPIDSARILAELRKCPTGRTCDSIEVSMGLSHQTASARVRDLAMRGEIMDSGRRESTRTGRKAIVWIVTPSAMDMAA